jgi:aspartate/methionine/tyrosine aminotransferase
MTSQTKSRILDQHHDNALLNAAVPPLIASGQYDLSADDIASPLDESIIAGVVEALESGQTHYVDVPGIPPLRTALADYLRDSFQLQYTQANIIVTAGIQESRFLTVQMIGESFGRIALPAVVHPGVKRAVGVRPMPIDQIEVDAHMLPTLSGIRQVLAGGTKLLFIESPSRLTGAAYSGEEVAAVASLVREFDATIIWDQGLAPWVDSYASLAAAAADRTVVIGEAFPSMGLSSWFIGYIAAPETWVATMQSQKQIMAICTSTASQYGALEASKLFAASQPEQRRRLSQVRQMLAAQLARYEVIPGHAASLLAFRLTEAEKQHAIAQLAAAGFSITDGADFGADSVLRLTVSHGEAVQTAVAQWVKGA